MKNNYQSTLIAALAAAISFSNTSLASEQNNQPYRYLELGGAQYEHNDARLDLGVSLELSIPLFKHWYLTGENTQNDFDTFIGPDGEFTHWQLGVGYRWKYSPNFRPYLQLSAETQKLETSEAKAEERGVSVELGGDYQLNPRWTLSPYSRFSDINIAEGSGRANEFYFGATINYQVNDTFDINASYEIGEFSRSEVAFRFKF